MRSFSSKFLETKALAVLFAALIMSGCTELQQPKIEPFIAVTGPPPKQELRWSNGKMPKSLDPARAAAAPETDIVRAVYDGLTELDGKALKATPAIAEDWESSENDRVWTFTLRKDARWSNGERITANDFVRSWKRLAALGDKAANRFLFQNIVGMNDKRKEDLESPGDFLQPQHEIGPGPAGSPDPLDPRSQLAASSPNSNSTSFLPSGPNVLLIEKKEFGIKAADDSTLRVNLILPDKDFPKLVANPIFRPIYGDGTAFDKEKLDATTVTNGAFRIVKIANDGITLEPAETHWDRKSVTLESVKFVAAASPESALNAYKRGEIDIVTNAAFEPLALKLLTPYDDFRRTTHSALNYYEVNTAKAPFSDRRVREALAIAIDRTKLTEGDLEGIMQPATTFFPTSTKKDGTLSLDVAKAKELLSKAGFPNGDNFPAVRLVVNRNDMQQRVARSVARMWKQNLGIETQLIVKESSEIEATKLAGEYDLIRRGVVLPSADELVGLESVFGSAEKIEVPLVRPAESEIPLSAEEIQTRRGPAETGEPISETSVVVKPDGPTIMTEADVLFELKGIPLYFPTSYSLVKPYVRGFDSNVLDAPLLQNVSIDTGWQPGQSPTP
ncbi:MAG: peptide ABC transporter substrate-binding protein [Acidobacteria bacterium]|nr:peptide ABC transporter substrate-binding protein [Acidobacteriota bacterium]MBK9527655.1 peptide ABC transporter substrate-binding protein [Acidobacteriota bacterium]MBP7474923.1 peptide ABC transporter substrate-binding protein [Pyrinomonadaceae bacterium]MBP9108723.1 peptide ABC transporter substrate-binding protein [Pyrinomonadaceae bacterium]